MRRLLSKFYRRRRLRVDISCPHGAFVPATYPVGGNGHRLSCDECGFKVRLSWPTIPPTSDPTGDAHD